MTHASSAGLRWFVAALAGAALGALALTGAPARATPEPASAPPAAPAAARAAALQAADTPVEGAPVPDSAPLLSPGSYSDTLKSQETLYYAVRVQAGQRAKGRFTVDGTRNPDSSTIGGGAVRAVTPDGAEYHEQGTCCHRTDAWTVTGDTGVIGDSNLYAKEAGTYYFKFALNGYVAGTTLPVRITITVTGDGAVMPAESSAPSPASAPSSDPAQSSDPARSWDPARSAGAGPTPAAPREASSGTRFPLPVVLGVGVMGLVLGGVGGSVVTALVGTLRRRGPGAPRY